MINIYTPQVHVEFGHGDVVVGSVLCSGGIGALTLDNASEPKEIGEYVPHPEGEDPFNVPIVFTFTDIRSLDVVLDHLNSLRSNMKDWEDGKFDEEEPVNV